MRTGQEAVPGDGGEPRRGGGFAQGVDTTSTMVRPVPRSSTSSEPCDPLDEVVGPGVVDVPVAEVLEVGLVPGRRVAEGQHHGVGGQAPPAGQAHVDPVRSLDEVRDRASGAAERAADRHQGGLEHVTRR